MKLTILAAVIWIFSVSAIAVAAETEDTNTAKKTADSSTEKATSSESSESKKAPTHPQWKGDAELGFVNTTGNTDTTAVKGKINAVRDNQPWRHTLLLESFTADDNNMTTAERYLFSAKSDYKFSKYNYWYASLRYENDRFSGYDYQVTESLGYGRRLVDKPDLTLDVETGPGAKQSKLETGENEDELLWRVAAQLFWKISSSSEFTQHLSGEFGENDTVSRSVTGLKTQIIDRLAMKITYTVKHSSDVPVDVNKTDTETVVTMVYSF